MIKICTVCEKEFECYNHPRGGHGKVRQKRQSFCITCSPKCSKTHIRIYRIVRSNFVYQKRKQIEELQKQLALVDYEHISIHKKVSDVVKKIFKIKKDGG